MGKCGFFLINLISINLEARVEADDDIVGEHPRWRLHCSATLEGKLDLGSSLTIPTDLCISLVRKHVPQISKWQDMVITEIRIAITEAK